MNCKQPLAQGFIQILSAVIQIPCIISCCIHYIYHVLIG